MNVSFLQELLGSVAEQGRALLPRSMFRADVGDGVEEFARALLSGRGEASGVAIARELLDRYARLDAPGRLRFFRLLASEMQPDATAVSETARTYLDAPSAANLAKLQKVLESPRIEFFRRLHLAPGAIPDIVGMRRDLLRILTMEPDLAPVDADLRRLFYVWFNRGFLVLRRIDWNTPAAILEKIIHYEAVHEIRGWTDLRRRLDPTDRRCFAFFHPSLVDEPLVFVEVALMRDTPGAIGEVLEEPHAELPGKPPTTAVFYSISNCQEGLKGITFGNFLLKQVVEELAREEPNLKSFVTLSPVPQFSAWLQRTAHEGRDESVAAEARALIESMRHSGWPKRRSESDYADIETALLSLAAHYFLNAKGADGRPVDAVARFHLGNGARLERVNCLADSSEKGLREACGLMVNYRYEPREIERNHEDYANQGLVACSKAVRSLLKLKSKMRALSVEPRATPALPAPEPESAET